MKKYMLVAVAGLALAACTPPKTEAPPPAPTPPTVAEAQAVADKIPAAVAAKDAAALVALFTSDAVLFDPSLNKVITTAEDNTAATAEFLKLEPKFTINERHTQVLDADTFVDSVVVTADIKKGKTATWATYRVTDVWHKQTDGSWKVVTEHASAMPEVLKARLPALEGAAAASPDAKDAPPLGGAAQAPAATEAPKADAPKADAPKADAKK